MKKPTLTKMAGTRDWHTHYYTQFGGVVFAVTKIEFDMPCRSTTWRIEASRPVLLGKTRYDADTLADARAVIADAFNEE